MSLTCALIYPVDPGFKPSAAVVSLLKQQQGSLANRLGFPPSERGIPQAEIHVDNEQGLIFGGIGMEAPVERHLIIRIRHALRPAGAGLWRTDIDRTLPGWRELEALIGTPLEACSYKL